MVVIGIVAIVAAISVANFISHRQNQQLGRASRDVYSTLQSAKLKAIRDNANILVQFTPGTGSAGTFRSYEDLNNDFAFTAGTDREIDSGRMPTGVTMQAPAFNFVAPGPLPLANTTRFTSLGLTTDADGIVPITNGTLTAQVAVGLAGDIRIDY